MISAEWVVDENWKEMKRAYSIATTQEEALKNGTIGVIVKYIHPWGMSEHLTKKIKAGDTITVDGAYGRLIDKPWHDRYLFISAWSWLSPMLGLFRAVTQKPETKKVAMIYGERFLEYVLPSTLEVFTSYHQAQQIQNWQQRNEHVDKLCRLFLSKEESQPQWDIKRHTGHVQNGLDEALQFLEVTDHREQLLIYVCWMPAMADEIKEKLLAIGIPKEQMHFEKY